jgi:hypothetical protein
MAPTLRSLDGVGADEMRVYAADFHLNPNIPAPGEDGTIIIALNQATVAIDGLSYVSTQEDSAQDHTWPRVGLGTPDKVAWAIFEIALRVLDGYDIEEEAESSGVTSAGLGPVRISLSNTSQARTGLSIISHVAWRLLYPYLADIGGVELTRVS